MDKTIDAAKTVHQLVVGAAVAVLFFVAAPDRLDRSRRAEAELRSLVNFDRRAYFQFLTSQASHLIDGTKKSLEPMVASGVPPEVVVTALRCEIPEERATLREWAAFANRRRQTIQTFILAPKAVEKTVAGLKAQRGQEPGTVERAWVGDSQNLSEHEPFLKPGFQTDCLPLRADPAGQFSLMVMGRSGEIRWTVNMPVGADERSLEGAYFLAWAQSQGWTIELSPDGQQRLLTNAERIADLSDKTPAQALVVIEDRIASARGQVSFLGFSLGVDHLAIAGPSGLLLLLLYMLAHLNRALGLAPSAAQQPEPWIALFDDRLSRVLTVLSTFLLPVVAVLGLSARLAPTTVAGWALQMVSIGAVGGAAVLVLRAMNKLREHRPLEPQPALLPAVPLEANAAVVATKIETKGEEAVEPSVPDKIPVEPPKA